MPRITAKDGAWPIPFIRLVSLTTWHRPQRASAKASTLNRVAVKCDVSDAQPQTTNLGREKRHTVGLEPCNRALADARQQPIYEKAGTRLRRFA